MIQQDITSDQMININLVQDNMAEEVSSNINSNRDIFELLTYKKGERKKKYNDLTSY